METACGHCGVMFRFAPSQRKRFCSRRCYEGGRVSDLRSRFLSKVTKTNTCWLWNGAKTKPGYGKMYCHQTKSVEGAHRVAYALFVGPIPSGLDLDHLCRVRGCVNPAHLEPVTRSVNVLRGARWNSLSVMLTRETGVADG